MANHFAIYFGQQLKKRMSSFGGASLSLVTALSLSVSAHAQSIDEQQPVETQPILSVPISPIVETEGLLPETRSENLSGTAPDTLASDTADKELIIAPETLAQDTILTLTPRSTVRYNKVWEPRTLTVSPRRFELNPSSVGLESGQIDPKALLPGDLANSDVLTRAFTDTQISGGSLGQGLEKVDFFPGESAVRGTLFGFSNSPNISRFLNITDSGLACFDTQSRCEAQTEDPFDVSYAFDITRKNKKGLDVQLTPRAGLNVDQDGSKTALLGALIKIGDDLDTSKTLTGKTWYLFAGADAESVTYTPSSLQRLNSNDFNLNESFIIGDTQAGIGYRIGGADLALTYFRRNSNVNDPDFNADAAALSLTWRR